MRLVHSFHIPNPQFHTNEIRIPPTHSNGCCDDCVTALRVMRQLRVEEIETVSSDLRQSIADKAFHLSDRLR